MTDRITNNINRRITRHIVKAGYSASEAKRGLSYAASKGAYDARQGYIMAMSGILYGNDAADAGELFAVENGHGPA